MISVEEALKIVLPASAPVDAEEVELQGALGRTTAEDVVSDTDIPCFDNSAMDGYAVRECDVASAAKDTPVVLDVLEDIPAGTVPTKELGPGQAMKIMTGAPVPAGADAIVIVEDTEASNGKVTVFAPPSRNHIRAKGEDIVEGSVAVEAGTRLRPQEIGLLASVGCCRLKVSRRPKVAFLSTGDEVIRHDQPLTVGKVRNSNAFTLRGLIAEAGGEPIDLGIARDTKEELHEHLKRGLDADILCTSGGVSVGDYDFVKDALQDVGMELAYWKVRMKPGKPSLFGRAGDCLVFGLPGNPVSVMVCFELFVRPTILKMLGQKRIHRPMVKVVLDQDVKHRGDRRSYVCANLRVVDGAYHAVVRGPQGSGILRSISLANALLVLPEDSPAPKAGDTVEAILLNCPETEETPVVRCPV